MSLIFGLNLHAEMQILPEVSVDESILNGHIIMIDMKDSLLVSGNETVQLEVEIGVEQKNKLFRSFLMTEDASILEKIYVNNSNEQPVTLKIIQRYKMIREKQLSQKLLN